MQFKVNDNYVFRDYNKEPECFLLENCKLSYWLIEHNIEFELETKKDPLKASDVDPTVIDPIKTYSSLV